jgi:hypothetical protein
MPPEPRTGQRLRDLKRRLKQENPVLEEVVDQFQELDRISRRLGFLGRDESHADRASWWPLVSVLGVYSSGKSSFINHFLGRRLQATGNQAVDDKFTVICYGDDPDGPVLPGIALDADPRFPFYRISRALDEVARGEGRRIDAYLQLKTCASDRLRGRILIDSPGFDADAQRTATLRITDHIVELSDLVLVFFDARHPETGSMQDTLEHLVRRAAGRRDSGKFVYILNQIDATAAEDNTEEVFAAWQRALAQSGLTAGTFLTLYIPELALPIADSGLRQRLAGRRDANLQALARRIEQVGIERSYRIVGLLEETGRMLAGEVVPRVERFLDAWRRLTLWADAALFGGLLLLFLTGTIGFGFWDGLRLRLPPWEALADYPVIQAALAAALFAAALYVHFRVRGWAARRVGRRLAAEAGALELQSAYLRAFRKNSRWFRSLFRRRPAGWNRRAARRLAAVLDAAQGRFQRLNDQFTNPSGAAARGAPAAVPPDPSRDAR